MEITTKTAEQKIALINKWVGRFLDATQTIYGDAGDLGGQIAYLLSSIADDSYITLLNNRPNDEYPNETDEPSPILTLIDQAATDEADKAEIMAYIEIISD